MLNYDLSDFYFSEEERRAREKEMPKVITNRKENKCPRCGEKLIEVLEISTEIDNTELIRRSQCVCNGCGATVLCRENYALREIEQFNLV